MYVNYSLSIRLDIWILMIRPAFAFLFFFFIEERFMFFQWVSCTVHETNKLIFLAKLLLKMGLTVLFTHLKIILLQYFQFSVK